MISPSRHMIRFLRWFCREDYIDEVEGDLVEIFQKQLKASPRLAEWKFAWTVIRHFRPEFIKPINQFYRFNTMGMYKNYLVVSKRNLLKAKLHSFINISGLAIGLACCLAIGLFLYDELNFDRFHSNINSLYRVVEKQKQGGTIYNIAFTPGPLAPAIKSDLSVVSDVCRLGRTTGVLEWNKTAIEPAHLRFTDPSFFKIFDFRLLKGDAEKVLTSPDHVVLTPPVALALFGPSWETKADLIGEIITFNSWGKIYLLKVVGIAEAPPANSHIQFSILLPMSIVEKEEGFSWDNNSYYTYLLLQPNTDVNQLDRTLRTYVDRYSTFNSKDDARTLFLQPVKDIHLYSKFDFGTDDAKPWDIMYVRIFITIGLIVLVIAIFNFVNLSTARATQRAKEIGIRKVVGAVRRQLIGQFLVESSLVTAMAILIAFGIVQLSLGTINSISDKSLSIPFGDVFLYVGIFGAIVVMSLLAGLYPAFYLSRFAPSITLKKQTAERSTISFREFLVVGQFALSILLMIGSLVIYRQLHYMQEKDLGFDRSQLIYVRLRNEAFGKAVQFKDVLSGNAAIASVVKTSGNLVDATNSTTSTQWEGKQPEDEMLISHMNTDADFLHTLGMKLVSGRNFTGDASDSTSFIINETAAKRMGWTSESAIGKNVKFWGTDGKVIGVLKDFHFQPLTKVIEPFIFRSWKSANYAYGSVFVKTVAGKNSEAIAAIKSAYKKFEPRTDVYFEFVDQGLDAQYKMQENTGRIVLIFAALAIVVSCMGLFGLATYATERRTKEIGIRKVLGASVSHVIGLLTSDFIKLVAVAITIAIPLAWLGMNEWLSAFAYRTTLYWWIFASTAVSALLIAVIAVLYSSVKAATTNPVTSLRTE